MASTDASARTQGRFTQRGGRLLILRLVRSSPFSYFMTGAIIISCVFVAMDDVETRRKSYGGVASAIQSVIPIVDWIVLSLFTLEMILKIIGLGPGFVVIPGTEHDSERSGYFASQWNRLDCFIVLMSWVLYMYSYFSGQRAISNLARSVRLIRLARPISWLRKTKSLRLRQVVLYILPMSAVTIVDAFFLLVFCITLFSILGLNLFGLEGVLFGKCVLDGQNSFDTGRYLQWSGNGEPVVCGASYSCPAGFRCSCKPGVDVDGAVESPPYSYLSPITGDVGCLKFTPLHVALILTFFAVTKMTPSPRPWDQGLWNDLPTSPRLGFATFNDFPTSALTVFTASTLDSWSSIMLWCMDAGSGFVSGVFFVILVWIIAFNVMNLFVVGIYEGFAECEEDAEEAEMIDSTVNKGRPVHQTRIQKYMSTLQDFKKYVFKKLEKYNKPNTIPLNPFALRVRQTLVYPGTVDECGTMVSSALILRAHWRDLNLTFGPSRGEWSILARIRGKFVLKKDDNTKTTTKNKTWEYTFTESNKEVQSGHLLCKGNSLLDKKGLSDAIESFDKGKDFKEVDERDVDVGDKDFTEDQSYFSFAVALAVLANMAMLAMKHFDGRVISIITTRDPSLSCCDDMCAETDEDRCPRGLIVMTKAWTQFIGRGTDAMNAIFTMELVLKIIAAWSLPRYIFQNRPQNLIDFSLVVISDLFAFLEAVGKAKAIIDPSLFRCVLRLSSVLKALRNVSMLKTIDELTKKALRTLKTVAYVLFIIGMWHLLGALIAMQSFSCDFQNDVLCGGEVFQDGICPEHCSQRIGNQCVFTEEQIFEHCPWSPYRNFNSFVRSLLLLFILTTGDNAWITILVNGMRSKSDSVGPGFVFFIGFYFVSFAVLYSLLIVVIIMTFDPKDSEKLEDQKREYKEQVLAALTRAREIEVRKLIFKTKKKEKENESRLNKMINIMLEMPSSESQRMAEEGNKKLLKAEEILSTRRSNLKKKLDYDEVDVFDIYFDLRACELQDFLDKRFDVDPDDTILWGLVGKPRKGNLRWYAQKLLINPIWNIFIAVVIMASTATLFLESKVAAENLVNDKISKMCDYAFFTVFLFECIIKILEHGAWSHNRAYFRLGSNQLEFVLVMLQVVDLLNLANGISVFRALRSLRILRAFSKIKRLQLILQGLTDATESLIQIMLIWIFFLLLFAIVGMSLFSARLYKCNDVAFVGFPLNPSEALGSKVGWRENCVGAFVTSQSPQSQINYVSSTSQNLLYLPRVWQNPHSSPSDVGFNFDNILNAIQTLFEVSSMRHWSDYAFTSSDSTQIGQHPIQSPEPWSIIYFVAWILVSNFFLLPLLLAAVVNGIRIKSGTGNLISLQRNWRTVEKKMAALKPMPSFEVPEGRTLSWMLWLSRNSYWQGFFALVLLTNACLMTTDHYNQSLDFTNNMLYVNWMFVSLYLVEISLKLIVEGRRFFVDTWNLFDSAVILASIVELLIGSGLGLYFLRILRLLRVGRLLRLVRRLPRLRYMIEATIASIFSGFMNALFIGVVMVIFAVVGNSYLSALKFGNGINRRLNFDSPLLGLLLLFVVFTGDGWQDFMRDAAISSPLCTTDEEMQDLIQKGYSFPDNSNVLGDCGSLPISILYFDLFFFIGYNVMRALVLGIQIENILNFRYAERGVIRDSHLRSFQSVWGHFDPELTGMIPLWRLRNFIFKLAANNNPMGWFALRADGGVRMRKLAILREELRFLMSTKNDSLQTADIPVVDFNTLLRTLGLHAVGLRALPLGQQIVRKAHLDMFAHEVVAQKLQGSIRGKQIRKKYGKEAKRRQHTGVMEEYKKESAVKSDWRKENPALIRSTGLRRDRFKASTDRPKDVNLGEFVLAQCAIQDLEIAVQRLERHI